MPAMWVSLAGAALGAMGSGQSQGGTTTQTKDPWAAAQPWLTSNLAQGQSLQKAYQDNPFNAVQQASYGNILGGNDYINQMVPGLLSQMSQPAGFDRNNPRARPAPFSFPGMHAANYQPVGGLMGVNSQQMNTQANPWARMPAQPAAPAQSMLPRGDGVVNPGDPINTWGV